MESDYLQQHSFQKNTKKSNWKETERENNIVFLLNSSFLLLSVNVFLFEKEKKRRRAHKWKATHQSRTPHRPFVQMNRRAAETRKNAAANMHAKRAMPRRHVATFLRRGIPSTKQHQRLPYGIRSLSNSLLLFSNLFVWIHAHSVQATHSLTLCVCTVYVSRARSLALVRANSRNKFPCGSSVCVRPSDVFSYSVCLVTSTRVYTKMRSVLHRIIWKSTETCESSSIRSVCVSVARLNAAKKKAKNCCSISHQSDCVCTTAITVSLPRQTVDAHNYPSRYPELKLKPQKETENFVSFLTFHRFGLSVFFGWVKTNLTHFHIIHQWTTCKRKKEI